MVGGGDPVGPPTSPQAPPASHTPFIPYSIYTSTPVWVTNLLHKIAF